MAVLLAAIICPIVFAICFLSQTIYFLYKVLKERRTDYVGDTPVTTVHMSEGEASCCMGWAWTSCIDKSTNRITLKVFIAWYLVCLCFDILVTAIFYVILYHYRRIYV
ncbi:unnamed protein product [Adineta ricciae]|uniref:Uncharacterized protein n=1 Tax=Adineta ricciae TaxID=249248 RepID=A0A813R7L4_ADIRI|nr:unnamed protein product [Adineta ricciae]CAF1205139.1 unnamed protein product [Adineta ricciae]